ncbi:hypothetical protein D3C86_2057870 [compost metagenome]
MLPVQRQGFIDHGKQAHLQYMPLEGFIAGRKTLQLAATTVERALNRQRGNDLAIGVDQVVGQQRQGETGDVGLLQISDFMPGNFIIVKCFGQVRP